MTTAAPASTVTPCPVSWCPRLGRHQWMRTGPGAGHRFHTVEEQHGAVTSTDEFIAVTIGASVFETESSIEPCVRIAVGTDEETAEFHSPDGVARVVTAIRRAADLAFGADLTVQVGQSDEFDAATAELVERAGKPTDVNRLVAAAIRFRNAYLGA